MACLASGTESHCGVSGFEKDSWFFLFLFLLYTLFPKDVVLRTFPSTDG
jgi:hypothetical protein